MPKTAAEMAFNELNKSTSLEFGVRSSESAPSEVEGFVVDREESKEANGEAAKLTSARITSLLVFISGAFKVPSVLTDKPVNIPELVACWASKPLICFCCS